MKNNFLTIITILFLYQLAFSQQQVISGLTIDKPVSWSGTVIIEGDVTVTPRGRLTIESGSKILFRPQMDKMAAGNDKTRSELIIKGSLIVKGQAERKVTFSSAAKEPRMGDWYGIYIGNPKQISIIDYAIIKYGYNGIMIKKSHPVIRNSQISLNYNAGILCEVKSEAKITRNMISENGYAGILCGLGARPVLSYNLISLNEIGVVALSLSQPNLGSLKNDDDYNQGENNIFENTDYDLYNHTKLPLFAENNSWGSNNNLNARIYDSGEDSQYGLVDVQPVFRKTNLDEFLVIAQEDNETQLADNSLNSQPAAVAASNLPENSTQKQKERKPPNPLPSQPAGKPLFTSNKVNVSPVSTSAESLPGDENEEEKKEADVISAPLLAQAESERPLATLKQQPVTPQINYDQIFLENFLDGGGKNIIKQVAPKVTQFGPKGRVIVRAIIGKNGRVEEAKVVRGINDHYDSISLTAAEQFEFSTGKVKGVPVRFYTNILFEYK